MDRCTREELAELRSSNRRTLLNMRQVALDYYPATKAQPLIEELYMGWLFENLDRVSPMKQSEMYHFCKWLSILITADHML